MSLPYPYIGQCESLWLRTHEHDINRHGKLKSTAQGLVMLGSSGSAV